MKTMMTSVCLRAARSLIEDPAHWGRGMYKTPSKDGGFKFCAIGACIEAGCSTVQLYRAGGFPPGDGVVVLNDDPATTHADILALFDKAIALAEKEESEEVTP